jgi:YbgC/YbaW family acyl-CoA thioester hydrolase
MAAFRSRRRVEWADTDLAQMAHFARYLVFMETAEHELLRAAGVEIHHDAAGEPWLWPRVKVECDYLAPLAFGDEVEIEVRVAARGRSSVTYVHRLKRAGETVAQGTVTAVCCRRGGDGRPRAVPIPDDLAAVLDGYR